MPSPPRILLPDFPALLTSRMEEGLPLAAKPLIKLILLGVLARAQELYQVEIHHMLIMGNHFHFLVRVLDPQGIVNFMDYFKTETAHAINRLLGRRKRSVWEAGYDSAPILTLDDVIRKIAYIYNNPANANLESAIELYPGVSSWRMFESGNLTLKAPRVHRTAVKPIQDFHSSREENEHYQRLLRTAPSMGTFSLNPNGWMKLFGVTEQAEIDEVNRRIVERVREVEQELSRARQKEGKSVLGADKLKKQPINTPYTPKKFSRRMWCICSDVSLRKRFIAYIKSLLREAREVSARWRLGDFSLRYPVGLFPPRFPRLESLLPGSVFAV